MEVKVHTCSMLVAHRRKKGGGGGRRFTGLLCGLKKGEL